MPVAVDFESTDSHPGVTVAERRLPCQLTRRQTSLRDEWLLENDTVD